MEPGTVALHLAVNGFLRLFAKAEGPHIKTAERTQRLVTFHKEEPCTNNSRNH